MRRRTRNAVGVAGFTLLALTFLAAESSAAHLIAAGYTASLALIAAAMVDLAQTRHLRRKLARSRAQRPPCSSCPAITDQARLRGETIDTVRLRYPHTRRAPHTPTP